jgi:hypothetical protein
MTGFDDLDPETRCFALVGQFFQSWSIMESSLHDAIGSALRIEIDKLKILCANIEFDHKIYILRTLIDVSSIFQKDKSSLQKAMRELAEYAKLRNMIAHHPFQPDESKKGVQFFAVRARGKLEQPEEIWLPTRFQYEAKQMEKYRSILDRIKSSFDAQPLPPPDYARALRPYLDMNMGSDFWRSRRPTWSTMSPAAANLLFHQAQDLPDSGPASQETLSQTPDEPEK